MKDIPEYLLDEPNGTYKKGEKTKLEIAEAAIIAHPEDKELLWVFIAIHFQHTFRYNECVEHCQNVLPQMKDNDCIEETLLFLGHALNNLKRFEEAIEARKKRMELVPLKKGDIVAIIEIYEKLKDHANAIKYYEQLLESNNGIADSDDYEKLAKHYDELMDYRNAHTYYEIAARANPDKGSFLWCNAGRALALMKKEKEAEFYFRMALKLDLENAYPHYYLAVMYRNKDDIYMAMHHYNEALKIKPDFPGVLNNLAQLHFEELSDIAGAIEQMERAINMNPQKEILLLLYRNLVVLYKKITDYDKVDYYKSKWVELNEADNN